MINITRKKASCSTLPDILHGCHVRHSTLSTNPGGSEHFLQNSSSRRSPSSSKPNAHFFFPLAAFPLFAAGALSTALLPCVAPPPPPGPFLFLPPCEIPNVDRSLFFTHLSGSGGGVTPGVTPLGTLDARTFRFASPFTAAAGAGAFTLGKVCTVDATVGGALDSSEFTRELGMESKERRYPELRKSRCSCAAWTLV